MIMVSHHQDLNLNDKRKRLQVSKMDYLNYQLKLGLDQSSLQNLSEKHLIEYNHR